MAADLAAQRDGLFAGIAQNRFAVVGRVGFDAFTDAGVTLDAARQLNIDIGGSAANTAVGICKLGGAADLITRVSDDAVGQFCTARLADYGVGAAHVTPVGGEARNSLAVYESVLEGHRNVIYRNGAADFEFTKADIEAVDFPTFGAMITAGTVFAAEPSRAATFAAFERATAVGVPIIFDVDYRPYSWPSAEEAAEVLSRAAGACAMIVGNDEEFGFMAGPGGDGLAKARDLAARSAAVVVYKMGGGGAITFCDGQEIRTGIYPVEAVKPVGAGDSFMAGLLTGLAAGLDMRAAVLRGSACAAVTVSRPGCAPAMPDSAELDAFLADHPGPTEI